MKVQALLNNGEVSSLIERNWEQISTDFEIADAAMPTRFMARTELSFHQYVKLLGYICLDVWDIPGDIVEIGVWKGKSLTFMSRLVGSTAKVIGIDPCELPGQPEELAYFQQILFPQCPIVQRYSQEAIEDTLQLSRTFKLLHIDGGHRRENVWADFLLFERFVTPGGYIVFDDYGDYQYSPEVGPAVNRLRDAGLFNEYEILGQLPAYEASYVLRKRDTTI